MLASTQLASIMTTMSLGISRTRVALPKLLLVSTSLVFESLSVAGSLGLRVNVSKSRADQARRVGFPLGLSHPSCRRLFSRRRTAAFDVTEASTWKPFATRSAKTFARDASCVEPAHSACSSRKTSTSIEEKPFRASCKNSCSRRTSNKNSPRTRSSSCT